MKKLITFCTLSLIASILFTSCSSNFSITKRHFNNGYYVDNGKTKHSTIVSKEKDDRSSTEVSNTSTVEKEVNNPSVTAPTPTADNRFTVKENEIVHSKTISDKGQHQGLKGNIQFFKDPSTQIKSTFSNLKRSGSLREDGEGLSLFWIIILVILILWVLGVISTGFAIGSIINLLLLAALILLILWLLRIV